MTESLSFNPEEQRRRDMLINVSEVFLENKQLHPGNAYAPITIPLSWLFNRDVEPKVIGYKMKGWDTRLYLPPDTSDVQRRLAELRATGLLRGNRKDIHKSPWYSVNLIEYRPAELAKRQVQPLGSKRLFRLVVEEPSEDGRGDNYTAEEIIYSAEDGLLEHTVSHEWLSTGIGRGESEPHPLVRARKWLQGGYPMIDSDSNIAQE